MLWVDLRSLFVLDQKFPASELYTQSSPASFKRGHRQTLLCQCALEAAMSVVYWSTGEGVSTETDIIGARFADGGVVQIQHGADYGIGSDASLTVNSLSGLRDTERFWCHSFQLDGTHSNCYTDVKITGTCH